MSIVGGIRARLARLADGLRGRAAAAGLAGYHEARLRRDPQVWNDEYASGAWEYLGGIDQLGHYSILVGYLEYFDCASILDLGCGHGVLRSRLERVGFERYLGIDPIEEAIARALPAADARTEFQVGDIFLPGLPASDAIVCSEVLYYVPELERVLDRIHELLHPDGFLLTSHVRHTTDEALYRLLATRFTLVSSFDLSNTTPKGRRERRLAAYQRRA
jgi:2-polyprenyl-6-hydroxyphenyl methylase/3-demethylubiquinone-9 3-methyltransferase